MRREVARKTKEDEVGEKEATFVEEVELQVVRCFLGAIVKREVVSSCEE